jgi:hypothetical protein
VALLKTKHKKNPSIIKKSIKYIKLIKKKIIITRIQNFFGKTSRSEKKRKTKNSIIIKKNHQILNKYPKTKQK